MAVLTVGPSGQEYTTIAAAIAASQNGDIIAVQAGTYTNDFATITTNITLVGVGGMVNMVGTEQIPNGKGILVTDGNITIDNFTFSGAQAAPSDDNGAGIRYETGNLTLNDDYFFNNEDGLLADSDPTGSITINNSEFADNGVSDPNDPGYGYTHNLYVNEVGTLTINNSYFYSANVGHEIKSRADNTIITNSRIDDGPTGTASYSIDLPNGGNAVIQNNVIEQGPQSQNPIIISYGEEGSVYASSSLEITGNTILNNLNSPSVLAVENTTGVTAELADNQFFGLTAGDIVSGPNTQSNDVFLATEPALDTSTPWSYQAADIDQLYQQILGRAADPGGLAAWEGQLADGVTLATVSMDIAASPEAQGDLTQLYQQILGRSPDTPGLQAWTNALASGTSLAQVRTDFADSPEAQGDLTQLYQQILGRAPDAPGLQAWTNALASGTSLAQVRTDFAGSSEAQADLIAIFQNAEGGVPDMAELAGMENQLVASGTSLTSVQANLIQNGPSGFTTVAAPSGSASLTAAAGPELFDFTAGTFGNDTISGFNVAQATIALSQAMAANFATVQADTTSADGGALIILDATQSILLSGVTPASLVAPNFKFS